MRQDKLVFDFGMHKGEDTRLYLDAGADVVALEANEALVEENKVRFAKEIREGRLRIIFGAVTTSSMSGDTVSFYVNNNKSVLSTMEPDWVERNARQGFHAHKVEVPAISAAEVFAQYSGALAVKIDIEGADQIVIEELGECDWTPEYLSIESEKVSFDKLCAEIERLRELGYTRFAAVQQAAIPGHKLHGKRLDNGRPFTHRYRRHGSGPFGPFLPSSAWRTADEVIADYRKIFQRYRRFGDRSWLMRHRMTRLPTRIVNRMGVKLLRRPLCGWYDTHARL